MSLSSAQANFLSLLQSVSDPTTRSRFLSWIKDDILTDKAVYAPPISEQVVSGRLRLRQVALDLRTRFPQLAPSGVLQSEDVKNPDTANGDTVAVDAFLFDEEDEEVMAADGRLARARCNKCGSKDTKMLEYVSHSCSSVVLEFMFTSLLPNLDGKNVLDVGSRLGAVLFGAHLFSSARQIIGIEINKDFCQIAQEAIVRHGMSDRASVIHAELTTRPDLVSAADVIVLHNVFEWFMSPQDQLRMWRFLRQTVKPGALLVTAPALQESLGKLGQSVESWVMELGPVTERLGQDGAEEEDGTELVHLYKVLAH